MPAKTASQIAFLVISLLLSLTMLPFAVAGTVSDLDKAQFDVYFTRELDGQQPAHQASDQFDCSDRIYTVVEARGLDAGNHKLEVRWTDPGGRQREHTRYQFNSTTFTRVWAWLQLNGPTAAFIGQVFDPSFGMDEFIGKWQIEVSIDDEKISISEFDVLC